MYYNVESINLKSKYETEEVKKFLEGFNLKYEDVDYTVVIRENDEVIATCSKKENILKCFAINENYQGLGLSNNLISKVTEKLFLEGRYHSFIFTKPENQFLFEGDSPNAKLNRESRTIFNEHKLDFNQFMNFDKNIDYEVLIYVFFMNFIKLYVLIKLAIFIDFFFIL